MFIPVLQTLPLRLLFKKASDNRILNLLDDRSTVFTLARQALYWGLRSLSIKAEKHVLIPCSVCPAVIDVLNSLDLKFKYYKLDDQLNPDIDDIRNKIDTETAVVLAIHYFGFPQKNIQQLKELCQISNIFFIEDCALALLSKYGDEDVGSFGDLSIYSLWKFLAVPDGGVLKINSDKVKLCNNINFGSNSGLAGAAKMLIKDFALKGFIPITSLKKITGKTAINPHETPSDENIDFTSCKRMSWAGRNILKRTDMDEIVSARRKNFKFWLEYFSLSKNIKPFYSELPEGVCPYTFAVLTDNRDEVLQYCLNHGLNFESPLNLPFSDSRNLLNPDENFDDIISIANQMIALPVHQSLSTNMLEKIKNKMNPFL